MIDTYLANLAYTYRHPALVKFFIWITLLGEWQIMAFVIFSLTAAFIIMKKKEYILPLYLSVGGSLIFSLLGKITIKRVRPEGFIPVYIEDSFSFPSNHAAVALAMFGFLAYIFIKNIKNIKLKYWIIFSALLIISAIGFSRMYLGVHYASDVLGGYAIGIIWLMMSASYLRWKYKKNPTLMKNERISKHKKIALIFLVFINIIFFIIVGSRIKPQIIKDGSVRIFTFSINIV